MNLRAVMVAATRQHVGKTSTSMGIVSGLIERCESVGFMKPVGQNSVQVDGIRVDHDVKLAKEFFKLKCDYKYMNPVTIPKGYTRDYLDGKISPSGQEDAIRNCFTHLHDTNDFTVVEGTGHTGVGSIVDMNNARVAQLLGVKMVLVVNGGIGSAFDDFELNRVMCERYGVKIKGVILNKVQPSKLEMLREYFSKALARHDIPLIGCVPDLPYLDLPTMMDFEELFSTELLSGHDKRLQHYSKRSLVTSGLRRFLRKLSTNEFNDTLFITHASRNDIILGFISHAQMTEKTVGEPFKGGLILTGKAPLDVPQSYTMQIITHSNVPILYSPHTTYETMEMLASYTAKLNATDVKRVKLCAQHYARHIDFDCLLNNN